MTLIIFFGFIASFTSVISLFPQIYKSYITKSCNDISLLMLINFFISSLCWVAYGLLTHSQTVWITNCIMLLCSVIILWMKVKYSH